MTYDGWCAIKPNQTKPNQSSIKNFVQQILKNLWLFHFYFGIVTANWL